MIISIIKAYPDNSREPVACLQVRTLDKQQVKFRQMAVEQKFQGQGFGELLIQKVENRFKIQGVKSIELNARQTAVGFYKKLGFTLCQKNLQIFFHFL